MSVPATDDAPLATIDVGTNTTLLLVARPRVGLPPAEAEVLVDAAEITRLGRGIGGDGRLGKMGIEQTLRALQAYAALAAQYGAAIAAVGTEALRRAPNASEFLEPAARILGVPVEVIGGEREAELTFRAVAESFPSVVAGGRVAVVDIGGGSTEIIVAEHGAVTFRGSLPLGSVRLHERHVHGDPPTTDEARAIEDDVAATLDRGAPTLGKSGVAGSPGSSERTGSSGLAGLVGVAGTVTTLAAMAMSLESYDAVRVHGSLLTMAALDAQVARLAGATQGEREKMTGLDPRRADVIFAGALLLRTIARRVGVDAIRVSDRGIKWGLFYERVQGTTAG